MANAVVPFNCSSPLACKQSIYNFQQVLLRSNRSEDDKDFYLSFDVDGTFLYFHVRPRNLYVTEFHIGQSEPWYLGAGPTRKADKGTTRYLDIGHSYQDLNGSIESVVVGFPRFRAALYDIVNRFTGDGQNFSPERDTNPLLWYKLLGQGVASLLVMAIETCRFRWGNDDVVRLLFEYPYEVRCLTRPEGRVLNAWGGISGRGRRQMGTGGVVWRTSPLTQEDYDNASSGEGMEFVARDCIIVECV